MNSNKLVSVGIVFISVGIIMMIISNMVKNNLKFYKGITMLLFMLSFVMTASVTGMSARKLSPEMIAGVVGVPLALFILVWVFSYKLAPEHARPANRIMITLLVGAFYFGKQIVKDNVQMVSMLSVPIIIMLLIASELSIKARDEGMNEEKFKQELFNYVVLLVTTGGIIIYTCTNCSGEELNFKKIGMGMGMENNMVVKSFRDD